VNEEYLSLLVEGGLDEAVGRRIAGFCRFSVATVYGKRGFGYVRYKIAGFNAAAIGQPILAIADSMDMGEACPPDTLRRLLPAPSPKMRFRLAVREIESWLLADQTNLARFLGVSRKEMPSDPEQLPDPKRTLVNLARRSSIRRIRESLIPDPKVGGAEGREYTLTMYRFVREFWDIDASQQNADSLKKAIVAINALRSE